jgi:hypothetical protein
MKVNASGIGEVMSQKMMCGRTARIMSFASTVDAALLMAKPQRSRTAVTSFTDSGHSSPN